MRACPAGCPALGWDRIRPAAVCEKADCRSAWRCVTDPYGFESEEWGEEE